MDMMKVGEHFQQDAGTQDLRNYLNVLLSERAMERYDIYSLLPVKPNEQVKKLPQQ